MITSVNPDVEPAKAPPNGARLLHNAATWDDWVAAARGQKYTAMCGKVCQGNGTFVPRSMVGPMEHCVVCRELTS